MLSLESLQQLAAAHGGDLHASVRSFDISGQRFSESEPSLMGVVNLSADSWYRESVVLNAEAAIRRGRVLREHGAAIVDIGAESTILNAERLDESGQQSALLPVVKELASDGVLVSVETYHPSVTRSCFEAGARILNLTGTVQTDDMFRLVADHEGGVIICFVQGANVREVSEIELSGDPITMLYDYFARKVETAEHCGVKRIWIDPGLGFYYKNLGDSALRIRHQQNIFLNTFRLRKLGWPVCQALPHAFECFEEEVRAAEPFFAVLALLGRADLLRTHEVPKVRGVLEVMQCFKAW